MARVPSVARVEQDRQGSPEAEVAAPLVKMSKEQIAAAYPGAALTIGDDWDELALPAVEDHGRNVYRLSALGGDQAQLVAGAMGVQGAEMPAKLLPRLEEGKAAEDVILKLVHEQFKYRRATYNELGKLREEGVIAGYNPVEQQVQVRLEVGTTAMVQGHTDEVCVIGVGSDFFVVVEAKAFGPDLWKKWVARHDITKDFERYAWQVSGLIAATGLPVLFAVGKKDRDAIDAGDLGAISELDARLYTPEKPPFTLAQIKGRVMSAQKHVNNHDIPECDKGGWPCPFFKEGFCLGKAEVEKEFTDLDDTELGRTLGLHYAYGVDMSATPEQKEAERDRKKVKDDLDKLMSERGLERGDEKWYRVWDEAGNEYEFRWCQRPVKARAASTMSFPEVRLVVAGAGINAEDHPE